MSAARPSDRPEVLTGFHAVADPCMLRTTLFPTVCGSCSHTLKFASFLYPSSFAILGFAI